MIWDINNHMIRENYILIYMYLLPVWLKSADIKGYLPPIPPPNIWQNLIRGHVQMNSWSANENAADKILPVPFVIFIIPIQT
jgi:hypothetical protein